MVAEAECEAVIDLDGVRLTEQEARDFLAMQDMAGYVVLKKLLLADRQQTIDLIDSGNATRDTVDDIIKASSRRALILTILKDWPGDAQEQLAEIERTSEESAD